MYRYYVHKYNSNHEVHREDCSTDFDLSNMLYLGQFTNCYDAVKEAQRTYPDADGCRICSSECNTK